MIDQATSSGKLPEDAPPDPRVRVLYEVSVLGAATRDQASRTGVCRVVEELGRELLSSGHCQLRFCVLDNVEKLRLAEVWLKTQPELAHIQLEPERFKSTINDWFLALRARVSARGRKTLAEKMAMEILRAARRLSGANERIVGQVDWRWPQILHLPFYVESPSPTEKKGPIQFQMIHDLTPVLFPQFFNEDSGRRFLERKLNHPPPRQWFFAISQSTKNDICNLARGLDPDRVIVTPLAASEHFRPCGDRARIEAVRIKYHIPPEPFFLSVCTLEPRKNQVHVIQAFGRLIEQEKISGLNLVLVGAKGWQYERIFAEAGATDALKRRVIFTGYVPDEELAPLYTEALAFLYLSLYEGFGLPVLEAMQCGTPVVTSDNSSLPEVVGGAGILLNARDQDALCAALLSLYGNAGLRDELRCKSLRNAARFSWRQCAQATLRGYDQALRQT
jgi:glycosyltransferase involved in cell wall biosynthesis